MDITINNRTVSLLADETILQVAARMGIDIPNMCYKEGLGHINSCMICMVKNVASGEFVPACSTKAVSGMVVETDTDEIRNMRREGLELLLSEHVGDCEAPCTLVCPAGLNIPQIIREVQKGFLVGDVAAIKEQVTSYAALCINCDAPCERVCRRGRIDQAVSIRLLVLYFAGIDLSDTGAAVPPLPAHVRRKFNSHFGKLLPGDKDIFLREASQVGRIEAKENTAKGFVAEEAVPESLRCLHCDCRKLEQCKLRDYADEYDAKQVAFKGVERGQFAKCDEHDSVIFEQGKCIKCGICIAITEKCSDAVGLEFSGRGYDLFVGVPFGDTLSDGLKMAAAESVQSCPTGALAWKNG